ncbi:MAG: mannitol dehydrogenase [Candidatus Omnitrophica bacterium]|nr:mannitol dehydrogenase [Candidatus Omnitrophota bacterium]
MKLLQFGAGNIGRGFLAELFHHAGYKIVFVEKDEKIVSEINKRGSYTLEIVGPRRFEQYKIDGIKALKTTDNTRIKEEISQADIIAVSVGKAALPSVAKLLAPGLDLRSKSNAPPINIIIAENVLKGEELLYNLLDMEIDRDTKEYLDNSVGLVLAVVSRMVPVLPPEMKEKDLLYIKAEEYRELPVDKNAFKGNISVIEGIKPSDHFEAYEERKIFIHNTAHAMAAYLGFLKGYKYIYEAMRDNEIKEKIMRALKEIGKALIKKHPFLSRDLQDHIEDLCRRFSNEALADTVARVGRDPLRKLRPEDRLVGACRFIEKYGGDPALVSLGISACLRYNEKSDESSRALQDMISQQGIDYVLSEICGIRQGENLYQLIKQGEKND